MSNKDDKVMRSFDTGATRDTAEGKLDMEGFTHPMVERQYAKYMNMNRLQSDGQLRDSDNWQKGIPMDTYIKSLRRHHDDAWLEHRDFPTASGMMAALCGIIFNAKGYMLELLKEQDWIMEDFDGFDPTPEMKHRQMKLETDEAIAEWDMGELLDEVEDPTCKGICGQPAVPGCTDCDALLDCPAAGPPIHMIGGDTLLAREMATPEDVIPEEDWKWLAKEDVYDEPGQPKGVLYKDGSYAESGTFPKPYAKTLTELREEYDAYLESIHPGPIVTYHARRSYSLAELLDGVDLVEEPAPLPVVPVKPEPEMKCSQCLSVGRLWNEWPCNDCSENTVSSGAPRLHCFFNDKSLSDLEPDIEDIDCWDCVHSEVKADNHPCCCCSAIDSNSSTCFFVPTAIVVSLRPHNF